MEPPLFLTALADEAIIYLDGRKIEEFLQGQLTCDLRQLAPESAVRGALCSVKGRVISDLWVLRLNDERCALRLRRSLAGDFAGHLARFAQFSRISVTLDESDASVFGIYGSTSADLPLTAAGDCRASDGALLLRSGPTHAQLIVSSTTDASAASAAEQLAAMGCITQAGGSAEAWRAEELRDGHYALESGDSERFTPQALNYDERGLVSFNKGCYTGQEVVARLHYKGQSKQRLQVFEAPPHCDPAPGSALFAGDAGAPGDRGVGTVLRRETTVGGEAIIAAMISAQHRDTVLRSDGGERLKPLTAAGQRPHEQE